MGMSSDELTSVIFRSDTIQKMGLSHYSPHYGINTMIGGGGYRLSDH